MVRKIEDLADFSGRLSFTVVAANGAWPKFPPYTDDHGHNLSLMFDLFASAMPIVQKKIKDEAVVERIKQLLSEAHDAYRRGDQSKGAYLLLSAQRLVYPNGPAEYETRKGN
jgi:hypothetical protein